MPSVQISAEDLVARVSQSHARLLKLLAGLDNGQLRLGSGLPGWTRGHVLAHLTGNARAFERQISFALRGELTDVYDGGRQGRAVAIARGTSRSLAELRDDLRRAQEALERTWRRCGAADWARPVRFRNATVLDVVLARWRETEIHAVDLAAGYTPRDWPALFALHALEFLLPRAPAGTRLVLRAADADCCFAAGEGATVEVTGPVRDLAAWLAGRATGAALQPAGRKLPDLGPWPPDPAD